jgi:hypothetical protein
LRVQPRGRSGVAKVAYGLVGCGALLGVALIIGIAGALSGIWRIVALALLAPILVLSLLVLWHGARGVSALTGRRTRTLANLREREVAGILALPEDIPAHWKERLNRTLLLPAGIHLQPVDATTATSEEGQRRLHALYDLLGEGRPLAMTLALPPRAMLALVEDDDVLMWDLSGLFERADEGDEEALVEVAEFEAYVVRAALNAAARPAQRQARP